MLLAACEDRSDFAIVLTSMIEAEIESFAIQTHVDELVPSRSLLAMGSHRIRIGNVWYGSEQREASALACSYDSIVQQIKNRSRHRSNSLVNEDPADLMRSWLQCEYGSETIGWEPIGGLMREEFGEAIIAAEAIMAPDGDEAFDDCSNILQFDVGDEVLVIGCCNVGVRGVPEVGDFSSARLPLAVFYDVLER